MDSDKTIKKWFHAQDESVVPLNKDNINIMCCAHKTMHLGISSSVISAWLPSYDPLSQIWLTPILELLVTLLSLSPFHLLFLSLAPCSLFFSFHPFLLSCFLPLHQGPPLLCPSFPITHLPPFYVSSLHSCCLLIQNRQFTTTPFCVSELPTHSSSYKHICPVSSGKL